MSVRFAVFCRTHVWDAFIAKQAEQLLKLSSYGHFYILADETRKVLPIENFHKFSHRDEDFEPYGLHRYWDTSLLWYNGDYPLYKIYNDLPHYDYYIMIEYDVTTNVDFAKMIEIAHAERADAILSNMHRVESDWPWLDTCVSYKDPWRALIPFLMLSRRAVGRLFERRRWLTQRFRGGELDRLPFCEAFVPTELMLARMNHLDISHFGRTERFEFWPPTLDRSLVIGADPAFCHPVLDETRFIPNRLRHESDLDAFFDESSRLRQDLAPCDIDAVNTAVLALFRQRADTAAESRLLDMYPALHRL